MTAYIRLLVISLVIGPLAFAASQFIAGRPLVPAGADYAVLAIFVLAVLLGGLFGGTAPVARAESRPAPARPGAAASKMPSETGSVKWFNVKKGYGFITRDAGDDVFVHYRNVEGNGRRALNEGQRVSFIVTDGDKGPQAENVELI